MGIIRRGYLYYLKGITMQDLDMKKEALQNLMKMFRNIIKDNFVKKPDGSPEHEAQESPEMENMEHKLGVEAQDESSEEEGCELPHEEANEDIQDPNEKIGDLNEEPKDRSPFRSDKERMLANLYKGGKSHSGSIGAFVAEAAAKKNKRN